MIAFTNRGDEMIREDIMERLVCFSDEEINNLNGFVGIDKSIFISEQSNVVDADKLLKANQQFAVRKHARFCEYPKHRHNYLEFMYVYGGEMVTIIDDQEIVNFIIKPEFLEFLSGMAEEQNEVFSFIFDALYSYDNKGEYLIFKVSNNEIVRNHIEAIITNIYQQQLNHSFENKNTIKI